MMKRSIAMLAALAAISGAGGANAAGVTVYDQDDKYIKLGGRVQLQYLNIEDDDGDRTDELFFRRLRPYIEGSVHKDWKGKIQIDFGKSFEGNEVTIKDAYAQYIGVENLKVTVGNKKVPFSLEALTSSKYQQMVERAFVGDHNFGVADRQLGAYVDGLAFKKTFGYSAGLSMAALDPGINRLDFESLANKEEDYNEGGMVSGRLEYMPLGYFKKSQGDFKRDMKFLVGAAAYYWENDGDNNTYTNGDGTAIDPADSKQDVDQVTAFEVDAAFRGAGFSLDAGYNFYDSKTVVDGFTGGIFENGETDLWSASLKAGYMILPSVLELVGGYSLQGADGYDENWERWEVGLNYFIVKKHDIKLQGTYRGNTNFGGDDGDDRDTFFVMAQYVF